MSIPIEVLIKEMKSSTELVGATDWFATKPPFPRDLKSLNSLNKGFQDYYLKFQGEKSLPTANKDLIKIFKNSKALQKRQRIYLLEDAIVCKVEDQKDKRDETKNEAFVGLQINKIISEIGYPNFVYTLGAFKAPYIIPEGEKKWELFKPGEPYPFVATEYIPGVSLHEYKRDKRIDELMPILVQIFFSVRFAYERNGFTHYDLHSGNVRINKRDHKIWMQYPWGSVKTDCITTIIDFGRTHIQSNGVSYGRTIKQQGVYPKSNAWYDIVFVLYKNFPKSDLKTHEGKALLKFFGLKEESEGFIPRKDIYAYLNSLQERTFSWESFLKMLSRFPSLKDKLIVNVTPEPEPIAPMVTAEVPQPTEPSVEPQPQKKYPELLTEELKHWYISQSPSPRLRTRVMHNYDQENKNFERIKTMMKLCILNNDPPELVFKVDEIPQGEHLRELNKLELLVQSQRSMKYLPILREAASSYRDRSLFFKNYLLDIFGG